MVLGRMVASQPRFEFFMSIYSHEDWCMFVVQIFRLHLDHHFDHPFGSVAANFEPSVVTRMLKL